MAYHYDANNIITTPLKKITGPYILSGKTKIHDKLRQWRLTPKINIMDNEMSKDIKKYFEDSDIQFQLVPPHIHRINAAESVEISLKKHFIAALCTVDPRFPFYLWDHHLPQVTMRLNMFWRSQLYPGISAYEQVDVIHNFEQITLAPLGCKVQIHEKNHK